MKSNDSTDKTTKINGFKVALAFFVHTLVLVAVLFGVILLNFTGGGLDLFFTQKSNMVYMVFHQI